MAIQINFLILMVIVAVASTRLIYHDGVTRHYKRMSIHCKMLAAMIVTMAIYSGSIGFKIHEHYMTEIQQKDSQIRALVQQDPAEGISSQLTAKGIKNVKTGTGQKRIVSVASEYSATTKAGSKVSVTRFGELQSGSMSLIRGRSGLDAGTDRHSPGGTGGFGVAVGGSDGRIGSLSSGKSGVSF